MATTFGVIVFPGSNCDHDAYHALKHVMGIETRFIFHKDTDLNGIDGIIVPGGFSYGDYLRSGAIARFSPVMQAVAEFAAKGGPVIGICNGFQILLESGLLPGAMLHNQQLRFTCKQVWLKTETYNTPFTTLVPKDKILRIPVAHGEGNYYADENTLKRLQDQDQIVFTYCNADGNATADANPNGALANIAGICNETRNVLGMMPHPERAMESILGSEDGRYIFESIIRHLVPA
jgi:phosphoribosylformylglycinamidine synthase